MKLGVTFHILAWVALRVHSLVLPTGRPLVNFEIIIKSGDIHDAHAVVPVKRARHPIPSIPQDAIQDQTFVDQGHKIHYVTSQAEYNEVKATPDRLVIVEFATVWCEPCKAIAPQFQFHSNTYEDVVFVDVDTDLLNSLADASDASGIPTFKFFKNGALITQLSDASPQVLEETIKANM